MGVTWAAVLGPLTVQTWRESHLSGVVMVAGFYLALVGAKAVLAVIVGRGRGLLSGRWYPRALRAAAVLLAVAGIALTVEFAPAALGG